ncbi:MULTISPECIES: tryptophanase [Streptomyces]|uniref:tryptophanase n=1 Tax=Streptomyces TaxID=1883 RepID=UPI000B27A00F|nr:tryptophanase [Streptomyces sp. SID7805]MYU56190.1 tryptophanase [Streptomyces sp. SID7805]
MTAAHPAEPWRIKMVEPIRTTTHAERESALRAAAYNPCLLRAEDVYIDLFTDSGTSAMSDRRWSAMFRGDESYCGASSFYRLRDTVRAYYGYEHAIPVHQGRGAENILSRCLIRPGHRLPGDMYFTTTRAHPELNGSTFHDVIVDEAHDPADESPFKGDVDITKLAALIREAGADTIPYVCVGAPVNMAGGQPISMECLARVRELTLRHGIKVILDAARAVENAYFVKSREPGWSGRSIAGILRAMCDLTDGATMSAKKDSFANIGGWLGLRDDELAEQARGLVVLYEGMHTYGGMAGRGVWGRIFRVRPSLSPIARQQVCAGLPRARPPLLLVGRIDQHRRRWSADGQGVGQRGRAFQRELTEAGGQPGVSTSHAGGCARPRRSAPASPQDPLTRTSAPPNSTAFALRTGPGRSRLVNDR